jgi:hypothetical protein
MKRITLKNVGQIESADIQLGDLTVFVGQQASGKSVALQWIKLLADTSAIKAQLLDYGSDWDGDPSEFFDLYFGEGMRGIWQDGKSGVAQDGKTVDVTQLLKRKANVSRDESTFLIPAQRVLTLRDGWPRTFGDYKPGDPYSVRSFSERLRILMEVEFKGDAALFPKANRLKSSYRDMLQASIFGGFSLGVRRERSQKRLVLAEGADGLPLPYMVWSAGQREFVPLLLGVYWLLPPAKVSRRDKIDLVIIEEMEMGLHPKAVSTLLMLVLELLSRGYRVCLSTHSQQILDLVWAWQALKQTRGASSGSLLDVLGAPRSQPIRSVAAAVFKKSIRVYYFERGAEVREISRLDTDSEAGAEANWGGLIEFSGRANDAVAEAVANSNIGRGRVRKEAAAG